RRSRGGLVPAPWLCAAVPADQVGDVPYLGGAQIRKGNGQVADDHTRSGSRIEGLHRVGAGTRAAGEDVELARDHGGRGIVHGLREGTQWDQPSRGRVHREAATLAGIGSVEPIGGVDGVAVWRRGAPL